MKIMQKLQLRRHRRGGAAAEDAEREARFDQLRGLRERCPEDLQSPRHLAKILCGLGSPASTKAKLTRDPLFGALEQHQFGRVVAWCEEVVGARKLLR